MSDATLPAVYFQTRFRVDAQPAAWPEQFVIITAYATTGQTWTPERCRAADGELQRFLSDCGSRPFRITGYSPAGDHAEPGWAAEMPVDEARRVGRRFLQHAIYYVIADRLHVTLCDAPFTDAPVGSFRRRVDFGDAGLP